MAADFPIIAITPPEPWEGEAQRISQLLRCGVADIVHVRHKSLADSDVQAIIDAVDGDVRHRVRRHGLPYSISCHSLDEAMEAIDGAKAEYALLSPVYDSISKAGYMANADILSGSQPLPRQCYALGGVAWSRIPELKARGFSGAAMIGAIPWHVAAAPETVAGLYFVTDGRTVEATVGQALDAMAAGIQWVQLRMKGATDADIAATVAAIAPMRAATGAKVILDDHVQLATALPEVDGVHIGLQDMPAVEARKCLGNKILGHTANTAEQIMQLASLADARIDYFGVGPFRFTTTKQRLAPTLGIEGYQQIMGAIRAAGVTQPVVGIGGITADDVQPLMATGLDGLAISGAIAHPRQATTPYQAAKHLLQLF